MIQLTIDGRQVSVKPGTTVYQAAKAAGIEIPVFCYQDRMPPFGACRVCLVEVEKMAKLQASCTLEAKEGMVVTTQSTHAVEGRKSIVEFLLLNHPLDCPVCDRGGECPLQEHALAHGPGESRFFEEKRHLAKALPLGPVLMLDRERCIQCARCTRFSDEIAGDHALEFADRGFRMEVATPGDKPAESKFIGNTIKICPVGALTSQVYRFRARPWDNDPTATTCTLCPVGCSLILDARDGQIMRTRSQENRQVNDMWLCDKGWFGYEFSYHPDRLTTPLVRKGRHHEPISWEEALERICENLKAALPQKKVAAWGGNPLTTEENFLYSQLFKGAHLDHFGPYAGGMQTELAACENLSYAYLLGLDLTEEFPVIWLRLRQAINRGAKVIYIGHYTPEIAPYLSEVILHPPGAELEHLQKHVKALAGEGALYVGRQYLNSYNRTDILQHLSQLNIPLNIMEGDGNSQGAHLAGLSSGLKAQEVLKSAAASGWDLLYVAGLNPALKFPAKLWNEARQKTKFLVVQDLFMTETALSADIVLPTLCYVEKGGTFFNIAGRAEPLLPGKEIPAGLKSDGEIFTLLAQKLGIKQKIPSRLPEQIPFTLNLEGPTEKLPEGDLRATFAQQLFDRGVRMIHNPHLLQLVKEPKVRLHPAEAQKRKLSDGQRVNISDAFTATLQWDVGVAMGTAVLPLGFTELPVHELAPELRNGLPVEIKPC